MQSLLISPIRISENTCVCRAFKHMENFLAWGSTNNQAVSIHAGSTTRVKHKNTTATTLQKNCFLFDIHQNTLCVSSRFNNMSNAFFSQNTFAEQIFSLIWNFHHSCLLSNTLLLLPYLCWCMATFFFTSPLPIVDQLDSVPLPAELWITSPTCTHVSSCVHNRNKTGTS